MIVYNITIKVEPGVEKDWVAWQKAEHIPDIMKTQLFTDYKFYRLLEQDDAEARTYVVQFFSDTAAKLDEYLSKFAPTLRDKAFSKWGNKFIAFRTKMEVVQ